MKKIDKKKIFLLVALMISVIFVGICIQFQKRNNWKESVQGAMPEIQEVGMIKENESKWLSGTLLRDCKLCGNREGTQISWYESQDNLGIISINTFELCYIEINRYDNSGSLIEEAETGLGTRIEATGEDGFVSAVTVNTNRGYASGNIHMNQDKIIDMEKVSVNLCTKCMEHTLNMVFGEPYGVGIINFKTGEIMLFGESIRGFMLGDYYVLCEPRIEGGCEEISDIDLHIFYCPERYNN